MDSVVGDDPTLPVDFDESTNMSMLPDVTTGPPDVSNASASLEHLPDGSIPGIQKVSSGRMSPIRAHTMKDYEQQISELKKENFSLKLRIYFMEERLQPNFEENDDIKTNIELKVEVESLKRDLMDKQQLLVKASNAVESLVQEKEAIADKLKEENKKALEQLRERLQADTEQSKKEVKDLNEAMKKLQKQLDDAQQQTEEYKGLVPSNEQQTRIQELEEALKGKDEELAQLHHLEDEVKRKDEEIGRIHDLEDDLKKKDNEIDDMKHKEEALLEDLKNTREELESIPTKDMDVDLEKDTRIKDLEAASEDKDQKLEENDALIKDLEDELGKAKKGLEVVEEDLANKEAALKSHESNALKRDKAIQGLTEMVRGKEKEIKKLCDQIDEKEAALSDAKEALHRAEKVKYEGLEQYQASMSDMDTKLDESKSSLHRKSLENDRLQRAVARKTEELDKLRQNKLTGDAQIDGLLGEKDAIIKELKDELAEAKGQADNRMDGLKDHYQGLLEDSQKQLQAKEQAIQRLTKGLHEKDKHIQEYMELARNMHKSAHEENDGKELVIQSLRDRLKQRDKAVEDAIEEKFQVAESKDGEMRKLRVAMRERDRELERANSELLGAEDKINSLEDEVQEKDAKNRQLRDANRAQSKAIKEDEECHQQALKDKDALIGKLQNVLADKDQAIEDLQDAHGGGKNRDEMVQQLNERIKQKDKLIQELLVERDQMAKAIDKETNDLLGTIRGKDEQIKDLHDRHNKMMASKNDMLKDMQKQLDEKEFEIQGAEDTLAQAEQDQGALLNKMRNALAEKDKTIEKLLASNQEKDRLFWELQKAAEKAPPQSPELLSAEKMKLTAELAQAKRRLAEKQALIDELSTHPTTDDTDSLKGELENKNRLLAKAKSTIDALQREQKTEKQLRMDMAKLRRENIELQSELQAKQDHIDALIHAGKVKDNIIQELRLQDSGIPVRNGAIGGDSNSQLQQALADHLAELSNLSDALKAERQLYVNITQSSPPPAQPVPATGASPSHGGQGPSDALNIELSAVQALRKQLEEGIKRNKEIRNNLLKQQPSSSGTGNEGSTPADPEEQAAEIQALRDQLEESRRWNASLQMRLDEMKQRADGVGSDVEPVVHTMENAEEEPTMTSQHDDDESKSDADSDADDMRRRKSLEDQQDLESVRSIPGQEMPSKKVPTNMQKQLEDLQIKLAQSEGERRILTQQLEAVMLNQNQPEPDGGPVVPILKQQLDQAKTLLMEKDRKIQEKEQQNQALRHHLGIGPSSPITPGRSMIAGLSQENTRLQRDLQEARTHNKNLEHHIQGLKGQCIKFKQVNDALQKQLEKLAQTNSSDDEQLGVLARELDNTKAQLQRKDQECQELKQVLGLASDAPVEDGRNLLDKLKQDNAKLRKQLEDARKELDEMQTQLDLAHKELDEKALGAENKTEIERLKKQLSSADKLNELLKRHIELNSATDGNQSFNPELIVDMAKEIEKLQERLDGNAGGDNEDRTDSASAAKETGSTKEKSTISAYKKTLRKVEGDLDETKQKVRTLQRRLQATEGTVHRQADKIKHYRREMHNAGIAPPGTPKRVQSDSNLLQSSLLGTRLRSMSSYSNLSADSTSSSASLSPAPSMQGLAVSEMSFSEFGSSDDISELKEQIGVLKNQLQRLRRAIRHLQRRLRASEGSRSPSPTRSLNDSWFELTANQDAFDKMRLELENLRDQLNQTNVANLTLQERNIELHQQLSTVSFVDNKQQQDKESQTKSIDTDPVKQEQVKKLNKELQDRKHLNKKLRDLLAENQKMAEETGRDLERLAKEVEDKNSTISSLRKQLRQSRMNRSSRTIANGQHQVDPTRKRAQTAPGLDRPQNVHTKGDKDEPDSANQPQFASRTHMSRTHKRTSTVQTDQWSNAAVSSDESSSTRTEIDHLKTKLRETERLSKTLKTELEIYRKVLDGSSDGGGGMPNGRQHQQQDPNDVLKEHLEEIRALRKRLEESINVNDRLREQLEAKLAGTESESEGTTTNIHLHQTNIELSEENNSMKVLIQEKEQMIRQLTEESTRSRVKLQRITTENQRMKEQLEENTHLAESLRFELSVYEHLQHKNTKDGSQSGSPSARITDPSSGIDLTELLREIRHLRIQLERSIDTNSALRLKLEEMMADKNGTKASPVMTYRITSTETVENRRDSTAKRKLFRDDTTSNSRPRSTSNSTDDEMHTRHPQDPSDRLTGGTRTSHYNQDLGADDRSDRHRGTTRTHHYNHDIEAELHHSDRHRMTTRTNHYNQDLGAEIEQPQYYSIPPGAGHMNSNVHIPSLLTNGAASVHISSNGDTLYAICTLATYNAIHRSVTESCVIGKLMETKLLGLRGEPMSVKKCQDLLKNVKFLVSHLDECIQQLSLFWKSKLPQNDELIAKLKNRLTVQEKTMRQALDKLSATNRMKEGMEQAIIDQLDMTHTVLRQARGNLEAQPRRTSVTSSD